MDLNRKTFKTNVGGKELVIEISNLALQANASVLATYGGTTVLVTAVMDRLDRDSNYMPLSVDFEEKFYAAGKILGSRFVRREGKPSTAAILSARLIDRTIRPLFDNRIRRGIQVVSTVLSYDEENDPDFVALMASSIALSISDIPWSGPVAGLRLVKVKGEPRVFMNPSISELGEALGEKGEVEFDSFVAGPKGRINMIELGGSDADSKSVVTAFKSAVSEFDQLISFQEGIMESVGKTKEVFEFNKPGEELSVAVREFLADKVEKAFFSGDKGAIYRLGDELVAHLGEKDFDKADTELARELYETELDKTLHREVLENNRRPDGRRLDEVRELHSEVGLLPRTHGSGLFIRGTTQALAVTTLASPDASQIIETIETNSKKRFMLHYNFPPYSVGETGFFRGPGRRDIGHGALAEKAILPLIPADTDFPYTIRVVSEILSSNGSSSMATVCATSLSLMDAGVPIKSPAAGIAMGLIVKSDTLMDASPEFRVLTDIQGPEDHYGDMDFKVAGTKAGVNAIQMDVKLYGVTVEMLERGLEEAEKARLHILESITTAMPEPRKELSPYAPRILTLSIAPDRIGEVIGSGGKVINGIIEKTGATSIDIEEDGRVFVTAPNPEAAQKAIDEINSILKEYEVGEIIEGNVVKVLDFGAIVEFGGRDGMIHVSELKEGFVEKVEDVVKVGDFVQAKIIKVDNGKIGLSIKQLKKGE